MVIDSTSDMRRAQRDGLTELVLQLKQIRRDIRALQGGAPLRQAGVRVLPEGLVIEKDLRVTGTLNVTQTADITGTTHIGGATDIDGTLNIDAPTTIGGTLTVTGHTWIAGVDVTAMLTSQDASLAGLDLRLDAAEAAIAAMQSTLSSHGSTLTDHGSTLSSHGSTLTDHGSRLGVEEGNTANLWTTLLDVSLRVSALENP